MILHFIPKYLIQVCQQVRLVAGFEQVERLLVYVQDADHAHETVHSLRVRCQMCLDVGYAAGAQAVEFPLDRRVILFPQRDRSMHKKIMEAGLGLLEGGDVFDGDQHALPIGLAFRQDAPVQADVKRLAIQPIVDSVSRPFHLPVP